MIPRPLGTLTQSSPFAPPSFGSPELPPICPPLSTPHLLSLESRKTRPLPLIPGVRTAQPLAVPPPKSALCLLPTSPNPGQPRGRCACTSLLEGSGLMPAPSPPLGPVRAGGSGFTRGCPEPLRFARAGSRRSSLARPSPAPRGKEGGRAGGRARLLCTRALAAPSSPSTFPGRRSLRSPSQPSLLHPGFSRLSVLGTVRRRQFLV